MGEIGISRADFLSIDLWELRAIVRGYSRRHRDILNMMRNLGYWQLASSGGSKFTSNTSITDLIHFPWDDEQREATQLTDDEIAELKAAIVAENEKRENKGK